MFTWLAVATPAWGGLPAHLEIRPVAATAEVLARFERWQRVTGQATSLPACQPLEIPEVQLCFRVWEGRRRRWVTLSDLATWGTSGADLREAVVEDCAGSLRALQRQTVAGSTASYLTLTDGDGRATSGILCPTLLAKRVSALGLRVGSGFRAALPTQDVLLVWPAGDPELDRILAVAAREIHEQQRHALTPQIMHYDGDRWRLFGRAVLRSETE
ncbi:MAG: hypothetical protein AAGA48_10010 [Myxococcota bacterium]